MVSGESWRFSNDQLEKLYFDWDENALCVTFWDHDIATKCGLINAPLVDGFNIQYLL